MVMLSSFLLTAFVCWSAYSRKKQFYPTLVFLTNNQPCVVILLFQCAVLLFMFAKLTTRLFFGRLQQAEVDNLVSQSWYAFFDMCLVFAFFQDELGTEFLFLFSILLFVRAFHWLIEERVGYMERTPVLNALFHVRILTLIFILGIVDAFYIRSTYWKPASHGITVHIALGIEFFILLLTLFSITVRYIMHSIDSFREHPWDKKTLYLLYVDIVVGIVRLALYTEFTIIMWRLHPFPLFIARPIYLSIRSLKKAIRDVMMSRRAIRYMNTVFRDATAADLASSSDTVCIICREEMQVSNSDLQADRNTALKRLPCAHIFHVGCLRSWFQRQQTCPTCRMDIIRQARQQELQGQQLNPVRGQSAPGTSAGTPSTSTTSTTSSTMATSPNTLTSDVHGRPPWMPPGGQYPFFSPWGTGFPGSIPSSQSSESQSSSVPVVPPLIPPMPFPPFVGMPVIYPGNLFHAATSPMPEPPGCTPDSITEARLRASAEARLTALRQINILLNASVLQMNAYLNAVTLPTDVVLAQPPVPEPTPTNDVPSDSETKASLGHELDTTLNSTAENESVGHTPETEGDAQLTELRKRRLEHFRAEPTSNSSSDAKN